MPANPSLNSAVRWCVSHPRDVTGKSYSLLRSVKSDVWLPRSQREARGQQQHQGPAQVILTSSSPSASLQNVAIKPSPKGARQKMAKKPANWIPRGGLLAQAVKRFFQEGQQPERDRARVQAESSDGLSTFGCSEKRKERGAGILGVRSWSKLPTEQEFAYTSRKTTDGTQMVERSSKALTQGDIGPCKDVSIDISSASENHMFLGNAGSVGRSSCQ
jgi:hypothetical protein